MYYAFDVLHLNGIDLTRLPLEQRRAELQRVVKGSGLRISQELPGTAQQVITAVQRLGLEGVIAKRRDSRYDSGQRSGAWVKPKLDKQQEFVIVDTAPAITASMRSSSDTTNANSSGVPARSAQALRRMCAEKYLTR